MATKEQELDVEFDEERLATAAAAHAVELEEMPRNERITRYRDLDGEYQAAESVFEWDEDDALPAQIAAVAEWPAREARKFRKELEEIESDDRYSDEHKEKLKEEAAQEWLGQDMGAAERGGLLPRTEAELRRLEGKVKQSAPDFELAPEPDPEDAVSAIREMELRQHLQRLDGDELERTRRQWAFSDDPVRVRAVFGGTATMAGFATEAGRQALKSEVVRSKYGDLPDQVEALRGIVELGRHNLNEARKEIAALGGLE